MALLIEKNPNYWKERYEKAVQTNVLNGHDPHWHNVGQMLETKKNRYGDAYYRNSEKAKATCMKKYGT